MFNYLLYTLKKDGVVLTTPNFEQSISYLLSYVYDYNTDPFSLSIKLLKKGYLGYYFEDNVDPEYLEEGESIAKELKKMIKIFQSSKNHASQNNSVISKSQLDQETVDRFDQPLSKSKSDVPADLDLKIPKTANKLEKLKLRSNKPRSNATMAEQEQLDDLTLEKKTGEIFTKIEILIGL